MRSISFKQFEPIISYGHIISNILKKQEVVEKQNGTKQNVLNVNKFDQKKYECTAYHICIAGYYVISST